MTVRLVILGGQRIAVDDVTGRLQTDTQAPATADATGAVVAAESAEVLSSAIVGSALRANIEVSNTGANPLTGFVVNLKTHPDGDFAPIASNTDEFTANIALPLRSVTVDPVTLAAGGKTVIVVDVLGMAGIQLKAASSAGTTVSVFMSIV